MQAVRVREASGHEDRRRILAVLCVCLVMVVAANSGLNVALPNLSRHLGATQAQLQWIVDSYSLTFAALLLPFGALGDRWGRRRALVAGMTLFACTNLWASTSQSPSQVIAARALMGAGAAAVMPATLAVLAAAFPPHERGEAIAVWAGMAGAGAAIGPVASGVVLERFWWGSVFLVNVPIAAFGVAAIMSLVPSSDPSEGATVDVVGGALSVVGLGGIVFAIVELPHRGAGDPIVLAAAACGVLAMGVFVCWQARSEEPLVERGWLHSRVVTGATTLLVAFFALVALMFLITQYFQFVLGYSPLLAAIATLPVAAMMLVVAPRSASVSDRIGSYRTIAIGLITLAGGLAWLAAASTPGASYLQIGAAVSLTGIGLALSTPAATTLIIDGLPTRKAGVGSAINDVTREVGAALGVAVLGSVLTATYRTGLVTEGLPEDASAEASVSVGAALEIAQHMPVHLGRQLASSARGSFASGLTAALSCGAILTAATAVVIWWRASSRGLNLRRAQHQSPDDDRPTARPQLSRRHGLGFSNAGDWRLDGFPGL